MSLIIKDEPSVVLQKGSRQTRALRALPILAWTLLMLRVVAMAEATAPAIQRMHDRSLFDDGNLSVPLIKEFYGVGLLDQLFGQVTVAFAQLQFKTDARAYWQTLVFLTEYAGLYGILLLEACRQTHTSTLFRFPVFLAFFAQLIPIGVLGPLYLYVFYVFAPLDMTIGSTRIDREYVAAVLPTVLLAYYVPHFACYLNTSLAARHWWNWVWQPYGIWGSLTFFALYNTGLTSRFSSSIRSVVSLKATIGIFAVVGTAAYWYTVLSSDMSIFEIFVPRYLVHNPHEADVALRTILQYDYICCFGAGLSWLGYHFRDLKEVGHMELSWTWIFIFAAFTLITCGPGTLLLLGWIVREEILGSKQARQLRKDE